MAPILETRDLFKFFETGGARTPVLRGVSFALEKGEFLCVMGPSGSGKTSLLHLLSGLDEPSGGAVLLQGDDLAAMSEHERTLARRRTIGYVFQFFNLLPNLDVFENLGLPLAIQGRRPEEHREELERLLDRFGMSAHKGHFPHQLSGGEMQRVSIARALAGGQPVLLCDEPTGNLSQKAGLEVMRTLRDLCDEDERSVLLVTHNPRDATFADRVLFLVDGVLPDEPVLRGPDLPVEAVHEALAALNI